MTRVAAFLVAVGVGVLSCGGSTERGRAAGTGGDSAASSSATGGSAGVGPSCAELASKFLETLSEAKSCDPTSTDSLCHFQAGDWLECPCQIYVNVLKADAIQQLKELRWQYAAAGCGQDPDCTHKDCSPPKPEICVPTDAGPGSGTCKVAPPP